MIPHFAPDSETYIYPAEYLWKQGKYFIDDRMPGYAIPYYLFLLIFGDIEIARLTLSIMNLSLVVASLIYSSAYLIEKRFSILSIYAWPVIFSMNPLNHHWPNLLTDTPTAALILIALISMLQERYTLVGITLSWACFMRPATFLLFIPVVMFIVIKNKGFIQMARNTIKSILPVSILLTAWIFRNYKLYNDFRPLQGNKSTFLSSTYIQPELEVYWLSVSLGLPHFCLGFNSIHYGEVADTSLFFNLFISGSLSDTVRKDLYRVIHFSRKAYKESVSDSQMCFYLLQSSNFARRAKKNLRIPFYEVIANRFLLVFYSEFVDLSHSINPKAWIKKNVIAELLKHPGYLFYAFSFPMFIILLLVKLPKNLEMIPLYLYFMIVPTYHLISGIIQQRYMLGFLSIGSFIYLISMNTKKKSTS